MSSHSSSYDDIREIIDVPDNCVSDVLTLNNVLAAILSREENVMDYICHHFEEVTNIAFGLTEIANDTIRKNAANIISTEIAVSCNETLDLLLDKMGSILNQNRPLTTATADSFTTVLTFLIKCTNCLVLNELPNSNTLLQILLDNIELPSIQNFLQFITSYGMDRIIEYFETNDASELFLRRAIADPIKADIYFGYILNLFNKVDVASPLVTIFGSDHILNSIFTYGLQSKTHYALKIVNKILEFVQFEDRTISDVASTVYSVSQNRIQEIIDFITMNRILTLACAEASDIIIQMWNAHLPIADAIRDLFEHFTGIARAQPVNTKAHHYLLEFARIASKLPDFPDLVINLNLEEMCRSAVKATFHPNSGFYIEIAQILPQSVEWCAFVANFIEPRKTAASGNYGGTRPSMDSYELYDELPTAEQPGLQRAIEAACELFGRDILFGDDFIDDFEMVEEEEEEDSVF